MRKLTIFVVLVFLIISTLMFVGCGEDKMDELRESGTVHVKECLRLYDSGRMTEDELCSELPGFIEDVSYENGIEKYKFDFEAARRAADTEFE